MISGRGSRVICALLSPGFGPATRMFLALKGLSEKKIKIFFRCGKSSRDIFIKSGFVELPLEDRGILPVKIHRSDKDWPDLDYYFSNIGWLNRRYVESQFALYRSALKKVNADAVIVDFHPIGAMAARSLGISVISIAQSCLLPFRLHRYITWWRKDNKKKAGNGVIKVINKIFRKYNTSLIQNVEELQVGDITFIPSFPEFDPIKNKPAGVHYLGPMLFHDLKLGKSDVRKQALQKSLLKKDFILVYPGRPQDSAGFSGVKILEAVLPALQELQKPAVVVTGNADYSQFYSFQNKNIQFVSWVDIKKYRKRIKLIIHHGGHTTCLTNFVYGIPALVLPTFAEREYNARNLQKLRIGEMSANFSPAYIFRKINGILSDKKCLKAAAFWKKELKKRNYAGYKVLVNHTMSFLK